MSISEVAINADLSRLSATQTVINEVLAQWPEHARFLKSRFRDVSASMTATTEEVAALVLKLAGPRLAEMCKNYCWMCQNFLEDEFHFRRTGEYRLKSFDEAYRHVYSKREYMSRYIDGILLSQVLWHNHAAALHHFITDFLRAVPAGSSYLEVGPGHGLFTYFAARSGHFQRLVGWDVSAASIQATQSWIVEIRPPISSTGSSFPRYWSILKILFKRFRLSFMSRARTRGFSSMFRSIVRHRITSIFGARPRTRSKPCGLRDSRSTAWFSLRARGIRRSGHEKWK